jgi:hypothetical protein
VSSAHPAVTQGTGVEGRGKGRFAVSSSCFRLSRECLLACRMQTGASVAVNASGATCDSCDIHAQWWQRHPATSASPEPSHAAPPALPAHCLRPPPPARPPAAPTAHLPTPAAALFTFCSCPVKRARCGDVGTLLCAALTQLAADDGGVAAGGAKSVQMSSQQRKHNLLS